MQNQRDPEFYSRLTQMLFVLAVIFSSLEIVPGWGLFHLKWPPVVFYLIVGLAGAFAGTFILPGYPLPGLLAGPVVGAGALAANTWYLNQVDHTVDIAIVIAGGIGALPGIALFFALKFAQDQLIPPPPEPEHHGRETLTDGDRVESEE